MKKNSINQPLYTEELEKLELNPTEQAVRQLIDQDLVPSPSELQKYDRLLPNGADRILTLIEDEKKHRRKMEKKNKDGRIAIRILSLCFGFVISLITVIAVVETGDSRLVFALMWAGIVIILGITFASFIKGKIKGVEDQNF